MVLLTAIAAGTVLPILPLQVLWINLTTTVALGMTLAFEPKERGIMQRPPRDPGQPLLTWSLVERTLIVSGLMLAGAYGIFLWQQQRMLSLEAARTAVVNVFVMVELFNLFNCRSLEHSMFRIGVFSNPWVVWGVVTMIGLQLLLTYVPLMNNLFHTAPIDEVAWMAILATGVLAYSVVGFEKWMRRRLKTTRPTALGHGMAA